MRWAAAAVVLLIVGCASSVSPTRSAPARSNLPASPSLSATVTVAPTATSRAPTPSLNQTQTPSPTVTAIATSSSPPTPGSTPDVTDTGWTRISAPVYSLSWSPDSSHLLIWLAFNPGSYQRDGIEVLTMDGRSVLRLVDISPRGWLDDSRILAYTGLGDPVRADYADNAQGAIVRLDGSDATPTNIPYGSNQLTSGNGAVAIARFHGNTNDVPNYDFVVWSDDGLSASHPGFPFEWSRNFKEQTLAVYHPLEPTRGIEGWLEAVSWPGLSTAYEDLPHQQIGNADFDPHGDFIALEREDGGDYHVRIATTYGGDPWDMPADQQGEYFWTSPGIFNMIDNVGVERSWDAVGSLESIRTAPAAHATSSPDGSTVIYWNNGDANPVTSFIVERDGEQKTVELPSAPFYFPGVLSPDGHSMALMNDDTIYLRDL